MTFKHDTQVGGDHYSQGDKPQHWDLATMYQWDPFQYQITKYVMRWKDKHTTPEKKLEDLKKARSFLDKYIAEYQAWLPVPEVPTIISIIDPMISDKHIAEYLAGLPKSAPDGTFAKYEANSTRYLSDSDFLCEGGWGDGLVLYTCLHCRTKVMASGLQGALQEHGACPGKGYVARG